MPRLRIRLAAVVAGVVLVAAGGGNPTPTVTPGGVEPTVAPTVSPGPSATPVMDPFEELLYGATYQAKPGLLGGSLIVGDWNASTQLNPPFAGAVANRALFAATMRTLFTVTADGHWKPDLAARMPRLSDGTIRPDATGSGFEVDLELRPGLLWSDGQPATMEDLAYTWTFIRDAPAVGPAEGWRTIDRLTVNDASRATAHFTEAYGDYLRLLASSFLPAHYFKTASAADAPTTLYPFSSAIARAVTIGPFKYATASGTTVELVRDDAWRGPSGACGAGACLDAISYRTFPNDKAGLIAAYRKGAVDVALGLADTDQAAIETDDSSRQAVLAPAWLYEHFDMNEAGLGAGHGHPALRDVVVRRSIAQAIDRKALLLAVGASGLAVPPDVDLVACTNGSPTNYWRLPDAGCPGPDLEAANAALDAAGYRRGSDGIRIDPRSGLRLLFQHCTTGAPFRIAGGTFLVKALAKIGIALKVNVVDSREVMFAAWGSAGTSAACNLARGNFDTAEFSYSLSFDPHDNYFYPFDSAQIPTAANGGAGFNFIRFVDPTVDAAIDGLGTAINPRDRIEAAYQLQRVYLSEVPEIALYYRAEVRGIPVNLRNFTIHPGATLGSGADTWNVEDWWLGD